MTGIAGRFGMTSGLGLVLALVALAAPASARSDVTLRRADPAAVAAALRFLCPHGGAPVRGLSGRCRGVPAAALAARGLADPAPGWWEGGLPPPSRAQRPCPAGTVPTAALARPDSVRCLPE